MSSTSSSTTSSDEEGETRRRRVKKTQPRKNKKSPEKLRWDMSMMCLDPTEKELSYRSKKFADISDVLKQKLNCTSCDKGLRSLVADGQDVYCHPLLKVLQCKACCTFYGDGEFSMDDDGLDKYCRWCGQGGKLYCCATCTCTFCKACMKRNLGRSIFKAVDREDWKCFICNWKPLWELRAICAASQEHSNHIRRERQVKNKKRLEQLEVNRKMVRRPPPRNRQQVSPRPGMSTERPTRQRATSSSQGSDSSSESRQTRKRVMTKRKRPPSVSSPSDSDDGPLISKRRKVQQNGYGDKDRDVSKSTANATRRSSRGSAGQKESEEKSSSGTAMASRRREGELKKREKEKREKEKREKEKREKEKREKEKREKEKREKEKREKEKREKKKVKEKNEQAEEKEGEEDEEREKEHEEKEEEEEEVGPTEPEPRPETWLEKDVGAIKALGTEILALGCRLEEILSMSGNLLANPDKAMRFVERVDIVLDRCSGKLATVHGGLRNDNQAWMRSIGVLGSPTPTNSADLEDCIPQFELKKNVGQKPQEESDSDVNMDTDHDRTGADAKESHVETQNRKLPENSVELDQGDTSDKNVPANFSDNGEPDDVADMEVSDDAADMEVSDDAGLDIIAFDKVPENDSDDIAPKSASEIRADDKVPENDSDDIVPNSASENVLPKNAPNNVEPNDEVLQNIHNGEASDDEAPSNLDDSGPKGKEAPKEVLNGDSDCCEVPTGSAAASIADDDDHQQHQSDDAVEDSDSPSKYLNMDMTVNEEAFESVLSPDLSKTREDNNADVFPAKTRSNSSSSLNLVIADSDSGSERCLGRGRNTKDSKLPEEKSSQVSPVPVDDEEKVDKSDSDKSLNASDQESHPTAVSPDLFTVDLGLSDGEDAPHLDLAENISENDLNTSIILPNQIPRLGELSKGGDDLTETTSTETNGDQNMDSKTGGKGQLKYTESSMKAVRELMAYSDSEEDLEDNEKPKKVNKAKGRKLFKEGSGDKKEEGKPQLQLKLRIGPKSRVKKPDSSEDDMLDELDSDSSNEQIKDPSGAKRKHGVTLEETEAYKADEKLRWQFKVSVERLEGSVVKKYMESYCSDADATPALHDREIKSLVNLQSLKRSRRKLHSDASDSSSSDNDKGRKKVQKRKNKKDKGKEKEQTLLDFFNKMSDIEDLDEDDECSDIELQEAKIKERQFESQNNDVALNDLESYSLNSSSDQEDDDLLVKKENVTKKSKMKVKNVKEESGEDSDAKISHSDMEIVGSDNKGSGSEDDLKLKKDKGKWRNNKLLRSKLSDTDTSDEERRWNAKKGKEKGSETERDDSDGSDVILASQLNNSKKKSNSRVIGSDSDVIFELSNDSSDDFVKDDKRKKKKKSSSDKGSDSDSDVKSKKKTKRKRIKTPTSNSSNSDDSDDPNNLSQKSTPGKGRKNIRRVMKEESVTDATRRAAKEEEERRKRILDKQKLYNKLYEIEEGASEMLEKLVLDFDPKTKEELISVHKKLVTKLKPHQVQGVKFMWDASFESVAEIKNKKSCGSGSILAHCMGLGKTFQVVTLIHTLLTHEVTKVRTVLILCPLSTVLNWVNEFTIWLKNIDDRDEVNIFQILPKHKQSYERMYQLKEWQECGGVMVMGYEMFRNLTNNTGKRLRKKVSESFMETLVDPGADLVVCDEGHLLKNLKSVLSKSLGKIKTLRRIVLTGTPLQNNLNEYYCMVQFVKPNLLGTWKEFLNRFVNPIHNGQFEDSTIHDVKVMKRRAHVLHKMLEGSVQRFDYSVLMPFLPPKQEYVISIRLSEKQIQAYRYYLENLSGTGLTTRGAKLFQDFQNLQRIWTHPRVMLMSLMRAADLAEKKELNETDSEGSLKDFIADDTESSESSEESSSNSSDSDIMCLDGDDEKKKKKPKKEPKKNTRTTRSTRSNPKEAEQENLSNQGPEVEAEPLKAWWHEFMADEDMENIKLSGKLVLLFSILRECEKIGDKVLVFSQSLFALDLIEYFLKQVESSTQEGVPSENLNNHEGSWAIGMDYFRLDGSTPQELRNVWCKQFNKDTNERARLFLISTRAGGLGINLYAANRVIIFDASWNPSHDVQSIFRVYRFGQKKPCYIYRFLAQGTMEEKIYDRQVAKLSLACRVVDEQQIERHYNMADLQELYSFNPDQKTKRPTPILPKDRLLAEMLKEHEDWIDTYHEHDSLLENKAEEELNEEERKAAWEDFENEKNRPVLAANLSAMQQGFQLMQQVRDINRVDLKDSLRKQNPMATEEELDREMNTLVGQIMEYYKTNNVPQAGQMQNVPAQNVQYQMAGGAQMNQQPRTSNMYQNYALNQNFNAPGMFPTPQQLSLHQQQKYQRFQMQQRQQQRLKQQQHLKQQQLLQQQQLMKQQKEVYTAYTRPELPSTTSSTSGPRITVRNLGKLQGVDSAPGGTSGSPFKPGLVGNPKTQAQQRYPHAAVAQQYASSRNATMRSGRVLPKPNPSNANDVIDVD